MRASIALPSQRSGLHARRPDRVRGVATPCGSLKPPSSAARWGACLLTALALGACSKAPTELPAPTATPVERPMAPTAAGRSDPSVPDAATVFTPADAASAPAVAGRSQDTMSRSEESTAMPMPGQNNDHSAPLPPARRASGP